MRPAVAALLTAVAASLPELAGCAHPATAPATPATPHPPAVSANAVIERVIDGDTVAVRIGGRHERVRLIGVDTPESVALERPHDCWGKEASAVTASLLPVDTAVRLERDVEARDKYGRLLAYVYRSGDGLFVNLELARRGAAGELRMVPNTAHAAEIAAAVAAARRDGLGLWGACGGNHVHLAQ